MSNQKTDTNVNTSNKEQINTNKTSFHAFYGSKLFVKCFAWFIFMTLLNILLASIYGYYYHIKPAKEEFVIITSRILKENGELLVEKYEKQGSLKLTKFREPVNLWLYDENLKLLYDGTQNYSFHFSQIDAPNSPPSILNDKPIPFLLKNNPFHKHKPDLKPLINNKDTQGPSDNTTLNSKFIPNNEIDIQNNDQQKFSQKKSDYIRNSDLKIKYLEYQKFKKKCFDFYKNNTEKINNFAKELINKEGTNIQKISEENFFGCKLISDSGKKYVAIIHVPRKMPGQDSKIFINQAKSVLPIIISVCAILCFLMARYLAKPIIELQEASRKFAKGDFSQKITKNSLSRYDEIGDLATDFNNMAEKIELGINSQKRLFNDISHELRSPLARMQVGIELLQMKIKDSEKPLVDRLEKDVNRMNALIGEVLQFSKLENKEIGTAKEEISLEKSLEAVCADAEFEGNTNHKGVSLKIKEDCIIQGNPELIERAFENIIRNGLRFTKENSVVEVSLEKENNKAIIKIADHGPGVPEDQIDKIFAPFYCINPDRNPQKGGIGLGLSIALRAIQLHKGNIKMSNRPEGGLLATIELPI